MHIAIAGPVHAPGIAQHLYPDDAAKALLEDGNYGQAPTALADALCEAGHRLTVVSHRRGEGRLELTGPNLRFVQVESRSSRRNQAMDWWKAERLAMTDEIEKSGADIVHAHWTYEWALASLSSGKPLVISARDAPLTILRHHKDVYRMSRFALAWYVRWKSRNNQIIAASPYMAAQWQREMHWSGSVPVAPNIVSSQVRTQSIAETMTPTIIEIADSGERKNVWRLIEAFSIVLESVDNATLLLVGDGLDEHGDVAKRARATGLDTGVRFMGSLDRGPLLSLLESSWVHAHVSLEESFGNTLIESMTLGTAVIAGANAGAVPWVLDFGRAGVLVDVFSPSSIAEGIVRLLSDNQLRAEFANGGSDRVSLEFSSGSVVRTHLALYHSAIDGITQ